MEHTLTIIKPTAVADKEYPAILDQILRADFQIIAMKMIHLTPAQAQAFYKEHRKKPFFTPLVQYITSGPVIVALLQGNQAVDRYRKLMGATDPSQASQGTLRATFGKTLRKNAVHGADSHAAAQRETALLFTPGDPTTSGVLHL